MKLVPIFQNSVFKSAKRITLYSIPPLWLIVIGMTVFCSTGKDDAFITYWASYSLTNFGEIVNYNGERVEQSSSLLLTLALSLVVMLLTTAEHIASAGKIFSILCGVSTIIAVYRLVQNIKPSIAFPAAILLANSVYFIYWSFSGMEATLTACTILLIILAYADYIKRARIKDFVWCVIVTLLFVMVRPETPIVLFCVLMGACFLEFFRWMSIKNTIYSKHDIAVVYSLLRLFLMSIVITVALLVFRKIYFDSVFPQPVYAKSSEFSWTTLYDGFIYLKYHLIGIPSQGSMIFIACILIGSIGYAIYYHIKINDYNFYTRFSLLFVIAYISFIVFTGGDWMEGGRFLVPILPVMIMFIPFMLDALIKNTFVVKLFFWGLVLIQLHALSYFSATSSTGMPIWRGIAYYHKLRTIYDMATFSWFERTNRVHLRDILMIYQMKRILSQIRSYQNDTIDIMTGQMGMIPYYLTQANFGKVRFLDQCSLTERTFTTCEITTHLKKTPFGTCVGDRFYFDNWKKLQTYCHIDKPELIYNLYSYDGHLDLIMQNGYTLVYIQYGEFYNRNWWIPGEPIKVDQFIAVRNDLMSAFPNDIPFIIDFQKIQ